jgi:hypothetical protein
MKLRQKKVEDFWWKESYCYFLNHSIDKSKINHYSSVILTRE